MSDSVAEELDEEEDELDESQVQAREVAKALTALDASKFSVSVRVMGGISWKRPIARAVHLEKKGPEFVLDAALDGVARIRSKLGNKGQVYEYSPYTDLGPTDIYYLKQDDFSHLPAILEALQKSFGRGNFTRFKHQEADFTPGWYAIRSNDPKSRTEFYSIYTMTSVARNLQHRSLLSFSDGKVSVYQRADATLFQLKEIPAVIWFREHLFVLNEKAFTKIFMPKELITGNLAIAHAKLISAVPYFTEPQAILDCAKENEFLSRTLFEIGQRTDLSHFKDPKKIQRVNKRHACGMKFDNEGNIRSAKSNVPTILRFFRSACGTCDVTGRKIRSLRVMDGPRKRKKG